MNSNSESSEIVKAISRLTIAVWVLAVLLLVHVAYDMFAESPSTAAGPESNPAFMDDFPHDPWAGLTLEQKLGRTSAVLITSISSDGQSKKAIVKDILKLSPGTTIFYEVGEEFPNSSTDGDGFLVLLTGSPASMQESYSIRDGRIRGLGDMPVARLNEILAASK